MSRSRCLSLRQRLGLKLFHKLHKQRVEAHELRTLFWELTLRCNLNCRHCGSDCRADASVKDMPVADFLKVVDTITPHVDPHHTLVIFSGGEALMREDLEICGNELYNRGYPWGVVTNGMLLDNARFNSLLGAGLRSITVSIDGFEDYHNYVRQNDTSFAKALRAIKMIAQNGTVEYDVVTCVSGRNIAAMPDFKEFLIAQGVKSWRIFTIFPVGRAATDESLKITDEQFTSVLDFIEATRREGRIELSYGCEGFLGGYETRVRDNFYTCQAGISVASIRADGAISGCTSIRAHFEQGNIYKDNFMDVWNNRFQKFRNREWARKDQCAACKVFDWCLGNGMHLRGDNEELLMCHYNRLPKK